MLRNRPLAEKSRILAFRLDRPPGIGQPVSSKPLTDVLVQGYYMSGDRNTIATALRLKPKMGVLVLGAADDDSRARELFRFYTSVAPDRCEVCLVAKGTSATPLDAVKASYHEVAEHTRDRKNVGRPAWLATYIGAAVIVQPAPYGTAAIGGEFKQKPLAFARRRRSSSFGTKRNGRKFSPTRPSTAGVLSSECGVFWRSVTRAFRLSECAAE
jgi:hypothetical protein